MIFRDNLVIPLKQASSFPCAVGMNTKDYYTTIKNEGMDLHLLAWKNIQYSANILLKNQVIQ